MNLHDFNALPNIPSEDSLGLLRIVAERSFCSVVITDPYHCILYSNPAFCNMTGYSPEELAGQNPRILQGPLSDSSVIDRLRQNLKDGENFSGSTVNYRKNGRPYLVEWTITPVKDGKENIRFFISMQKDVTQLHAEKSTGELLAKAVDAAFDGIFITDANGVIEFVNQGFESITGYTSTEVIGRKPSILKSDKHETVFYDGLWKHLNSGVAFRAMIVNRHKAGHDIHCHQTITPVQNAKSETTHFISIVKDMTAQVSEELELRKQASRDAMTGLLNRRAGELELDLLLIQADERKSPFCILVADIDHFKRVNDTFGHSKGDDVIRSVAAVLLDATRESDVCIRWGGEEFVVLLPFCELAKGVEIAERIQQELAGRMFDEVAQITVSIGVTESEARDTAAAILARADRLLYKSKNDGRNRISIG